MILKNYFKFFLILLIFLTFSGIYKLYNKKNDKENVSSKIEQNFLLEKDLNIIKDVAYSAKDINGNEYLITAKEGYTNLLNKEIILLKNIKALIILNDGSNINIYSKYANYNVENYDTIFREEVMLEYLDSKLSADYLEFSLKKNLILMSENIIFNNPSNTIKADVLEINIKNKDTKIYMNNLNKKVNIKKLN